MEICWEKKLKAKLFQHILCVSGPVSAVPRQAAAASPGALWEMGHLRSKPDLVNQKLWNRHPAICVLTNLPGLLLKRYTRRVPVSGKCQHFLRTCSSPLPTGVLWLLKCPPAPCTHGKLKCTRHSSRCSWYGWCCTKPHIDLGKHIVQWLCLVSRVPPPVPCPYPLRLWKWMLRGSAYPIQRDTDSSPITLLTQAVWDISVSRRATRKNGFYLRWQR